MSDVSSAKKLNIASDMTERAIECAIEEGEELCLGGKPNVLICNPCNAVDAGRLAEKFGLSVIILPIIPEDAWALCYDYSAIYSEGV